MSTFKKIFQSTVFLTASHFFNRVCNALIAIIVARYLGVEKFGIYSTALALTNAFLIANDIGATTMLMREGSRDEKKIGLYLGTSNLVQLLASIGFFILALTTAKILNYDYLTFLLVILIGLSTAVYEFRKSFRAVLRIFLRLKFFSYLEIINGLLIFISIYCASYIIKDRTIGLVVIAAIPLLFNFLMILALFIYDRKLVKAEYHLKQIWPTVKVSYIYSIYEIVYTVYFQIGILMVEAMRDKKEAGLYSAASKIVLLALIIPQMIFQVALPLMFKYSKVDMEKYKRIHNFIFRYLNAFALPMACIFFVLAEPIMRIIYKKPDYLVAAPALQILAIFIIARFIGNVSGQSLTTMDKQKDKVIAEISSIVLLIILNIILIPKYGYFGAAVATVITEIIFRITFIIMDLKYLKLNHWQYLKELISPALASLILGIFLIFTKSLFNVIFLLFCSCILYVFLLWIFKFFKKYDISLFKQLIPAKFKKNESSTDGSR